MERVEIRDRRKDQVLPRTHPAVGKKGQRLDAQTIMDWSWDSVCSPVRVSFVSEHHQWGKALTR